jgi:hypothetical protein
MYNDDVRNYNDQGNGQVAGGLGYELIRHRIQQPGKG